MKKIISFKKNLEFPSMIGEITAIALEHNLKFIDESNISGEFIITGKYKLTEASRLEEDFTYNIPAEIILNENLDLSTAKISIDDFYYEIENDDTMNCYIDVKVEGVELIEDIKESKKQIIDDSKEVEEQIILKDHPKKINHILKEELRECDGDEKKEEEKEIPTKKENQQESLFASISSSDETFKAYSVYIVREEETIESILTKYHITKEELESYNDLSNITIGTKLIIPTSNE